MSISLAEAELRVLVEASANQRAAVSAVDQALALATDELNYLLQRANMTITNGGRAQEDGAAATAERGLVVLQNQVKQIRDKLSESDRSVGELEKSIGHMKTTKRSLTGPQQAANALNQASSEAVKVGYSCCHDVSVIVE